VLGCVWHAGPGGFFVSLITRGMCHGRTYQFVPLVAVHGCESCQTGRFALSFEVVAGDATWMIEFTCPAF
jgi:hypothetical protein